MKFSTVEVLSTSRVEVARAVAQIIVNASLHSIKIQADAAKSRGIKHCLWEIESTEYNERQVKKQMEDIIGCAMQFLEFKAIYIMPISLAPS
ncbi:transcription factor bHLH66-like isoform X2 [Phalaenopsis equestris]|uniref:transcription factor bHLH66-like isoform X2 n=1 Tax=Phalaenopsis equestris TaxID=78828 RepID=UPI0009E53F2D|nr:transcription factor bHLH66-like isoform X2 [Phalaenopsis equestris]